MKYITKEVRIGIAGIAALCILVYGINYLKGINMFKPSRYFYVKFQNVNGLTKSSPVFADGFRVGMSLSVASHRVTLSQFCIFSLVSKDIML